MTACRRWSFIIPTLIIGCGTAGLIVACHPSSSGTRSSGMQAPGFDDMKKVRFHFGRTETTHAFTPDKVTIDNELEPIPSEEIQALFAATTAPLFRNVISDVNKVENLNEFLPSISEELRKAFLSIVQQVNDRLPSFPYVVNYGLIAYKQREVRFADDGYSFTGSRSESGIMRKPDNFYQMISDNMKKIQEEGYKRRANNFQNYFLGSVLSLSLHKDNSKAVFQVALGLNPRKLNIPPPEAAEVNLSQLVVPDNGKADLSTVMLINVGMSLTKDVPPTIKVRFGALKGLVELSQAQAELQIEEPVSQGESTKTAWQNLLANPLMFTANIGDFLKAATCNKSNNAQPYLSGVLKKDGYKQLPGGTKLSDKALAFLEKDQTVPITVRFQDVDLNTQTGGLNNIQLGIAAGLNFGGYKPTVGCLDMPGVEEQVKQEVSAMVAGQIASLKSKSADFLKDLSGGK